MAESVKWGSTEQLLPSFYLEGDHCYEAES